jgi:integrase/recombinase XerD
MAAPTREANTLTFGDATKAYIREQRQFGRLRSANSVRSYESVLRRHHEDLPRRSPRTTSREDLKKTLARWGPGTPSQYHAHSVLISFYEWMVQEGLRKDNPARQLRRTRIEPKAVFRLTREEAAAMMAACETPRERRIVYLGLLTGARVGEIAAMRVRHLAREGWVHFTRDIAKGMRERWVPVLPELEPIVAEIVTNVSSDAFVIPTRNRISAGQPATRTTISRLVRQVAERAGISGDVHPHTLRHSFGDHIAKFAGLRVAQELMGHADVSTTQRIYTSRPDLDELTRSVRDFRYREDREGE